MLKTPFEKKMPDLEIKPIEPMVKSKSTDVLAQRVEKSSFDMNFIDQFRHNRAASAEVRQKLSEIAATIVEKQKIEIAQKLMLELDINKKAAFQQYMDQVGTLNKLVVQKSNNMERDLRDILFEEIFAIRAEEKLRTDQIRALGLDQTAEDEEIKRLDDWMELAKGQVEGKISKLVETHSATLTVTLEVMKDAVFDGRDVIDSE